MRSRPLAMLTLLLGTAGVYFAGAKAGLALASLAPQVTLIWPPTGIALAAVLLFGRGCGRRSRSARSSRTSPPRSPC